MTCPRCKAVVGYRTSEDDTFGCYSCGEVRFGVPLNLPLLRNEVFSTSKGARKDIEELPQCIDCNVVISRGSKRCKPCSNKVLGLAMNSDERKKKGRKNDAWGRMPITPRETNVVAGKGGSRN
jgi:hypothetical protein